MKRPSKRSALVFNKDEIIEIRIRVARIFTMLNSGVARISEFKFKLCKYIHLNKPCNGTKSNAFMGGK